MKQMNMIEELNMDGFQIVNSEMFNHASSRYNVTCSIWPSKISFSRMTLEKLNFCDYVKIQVHPENKCLIVAPVTSSDKQSIRWTREGNEKEFRNMESKMFGEYLYRIWKLNPKSNYRTMGRLVSSNKKVMMLFDFSRAEVLKSRSQKENG